MYQELHKWEESIAVAEQRQHPEVATLKSNYFKWLTQTGQEEKAAEQMEREHDLVGACPVDADRDRAARNVRPVADCGSAGAAATGGSLRMAKAPPSTATGRLCGGSPSLRARVVRL